MKQAKFTIADSPVFNGYTDGTTWNGFECPTFDKAEAIKVVDFINSNSMYKVLEFVSGGIIEYDENGEDVTLIRPLIILVNGKDVETFPIGQGGWTWERA